MPGDKPNLPEGSKSLEGRPPEAEGNLQLPRHTRPNQSRLIWTGLLGMRATAIYGRWPSSKEKVVARLEFELAYYYVADQYLNHYGTRTIDIYHRHHQVLLIVQNSLRLSCHLSLRPIPPCVMKPHNTYTIIHGNIVNNNDKRTHSFRKIYLSHFILERVAKGLMLVMSER